MKMLSYFASAALLFGSGAVIVAQTAGKITPVSGLQTKYQELKRNIQETAEKMPEADFAFRPRPEIRTFGELFGHIANSQFNNCSSAKGEPNPNQGTDNELKTTKADLVKALDASFAYCDPVYAAVTDQTAAQFVRSGENEVTRGYALMNNVWHNAEMYGAAATYLRLKGLITRDGADDLKRHR